MQIVDEGVICLSSNNPDEEYFFVASTASSPAQKKTWHRCWIDDRSHAHLHISAIANMAVTINAMNPAGRNEPSPKTTILNVKEKAQHFRHSA